MAGVSWDFASWGGLGVTATQVDEKNGLLGGYGSGALSIADSANTTALGVSARIGFGDGWVTTASYSEGITQLDLKPSSLFSSATDLHSRAYGIAVAKHGLFGEDSLGFAVTRPIQIYSGSAEITAADGVDANNDLVLNRDDILAEQLRRAGVNARFAGSAMMDTLVTGPYGAAGKRRHPVAIAILPGSRADKAENFKLQLAALRLLPGIATVDLFMPLARAEDAAQLAAATGLRLDGDTLGDDTLTIHHATGSMGPTRIAGMGGLRYWKDGRDVYDVIMGLLDYPQTEAHPGFTL